MLDLILELFGATLLIGQAVHFSFVADAGIGVASTARSIIPDTGRTGIANDHVNQAEAGAA